MFESPRGHHFTGEPPCPDYLSSGYHKPADEYDAATWDLRGVEQDVRGFFETGWRVANDTRRPNWRYGNSFRTLRDR